MNCKGKELDDSSVMDLPERREVRCTSRDVLVAIGIGAKDIGITRIGYPEFQAFAHLLQKREGLFPDYIFNGFSWPTKQGGVDFPHSPEMTEDLNSLTSSGSFREPTGPLAYELTPRPEGLREKYIERLETGRVLTFAELRIMAAESLRNPEQLLEQSYQLYIDGLGKQAQV